MIKRLLVFFSFFVITGSFAQDLLDTIYLDNPSFENVQYESLRYWTDCSEANESPYDVHKSKKELFSVTEEAFDGDYFVGLVVRDNGTMEGLSQRLYEPLLASQLYQFSALLRCPRRYISRSLITGEEVNYNEPISFAVYGGNSPCETKTLLGITEPVTGFEWMQYDFVLEPVEDYEYIILHAVYAPTLSPYNGGVLVDWLSDIYEIE